MLNIKFIQPLIKPSFKSIRLVGNFKHFKTFAEKLKIRKDYYQILGISRTATEEEIKIAYRNLAKKYHPDVSIDPEKHEPNVEKFRDIAEAYAVLSNKSTRLEYDTKLENIPDMIYNSEKLKKMNEANAERDITGNKIKPSPLKGSYAEYKLEKLKEMRKEFNVDDNGFYKGGVPAPFKGSVRGTALGNIGMAHSPNQHNEMNDRPHVAPQVTTVEAKDHKDFMNSKDSF